MPLISIRPYLFAMLLTISAVALPTAAAAQNLKPGDTSILATYYEIRDANCLALRAPRVVITQMPRLGTATVQQTNGLTDGSGRCAYKPVAVARIVYQADKPGTDALAWEVKYQTKSLGVRRYSSTVGIAPGP